MILFAGFLFWKPAFSQSVPVEIFAGDKKATLDIMFFKYFKKKKINPIQTFCFLIEIERVLIIE